MKSCQYFLILLLVTFPLISLTPVPDRKMGAMQLKISVINATIEDMGIHFKMNETKKIAKQDEGGGGSVVEDVVEAISGAAAALLTDGFQPGKFLAQVTQAIPGGSGESVSEAIDTSSDSINKIFNEKIKGLHELIVRTTLASNITNATTPNPLTVNSNTGTASSPKSSRTNQKQTPLTIASYIQHSGANLNNQFQSNNAAINRSVVSSSQYQGNQIAPQYPGISPSVFNQKYLGYPPVITNPQPQGNHQAITNQHYIGNQQMITNKPRVQETVKDRGNSIYLGNQIAAAFSSTKYPLKSEEANQHTNERIQSNNIHSTSNSQNFGNTQQSLNLQNAGSFPALTNEKISGNSPTLNNEQILQLLQNNYILRQSILQAQLKNTTTLPQNGQVLTSIVDGVKKPFPAFSNNVLKVLGITQKDINQAMKSTTTARSRNRDNDDDDDDDVNARRKRTGLLVKPVE